MGNYYSYNASDIIPLIYQWYSPDSSDTSNVGDTTPGGYSDVWCNLPATGVINCMITGRPQTGRPMKARLSNIQVRTIDENAYPEVETNQEIAQEVANKAQALVDQFGYYQFLNLVDFMQKNPGAVSFGLNLINRK